MKTLNSLVTIALLASAPAFAASSKTEHNKKIVAEFYDLAFNKHQPAEAVKKYVGDKYIQHNPFVANGSQPFVDFFTGFFKEHPGVTAEIKRSVAEGDLVVIHVLSKVGAQDRGRAVVDIFRLENGKIVEHWDVAQPIPEKSANDNTMF